MNIYFNRRKVMTIIEVCEKYDLTPDTQRYYERVGMIPPVTRTARFLQGWNCRKIR